MAAEVKNTMADNDYNSAIDRAIEKILVGGGIAIDRTAQSLVRKDTGRLRGSITYATRKEGNRVSEGANSRDGVSRPTSKWTLHVGSNVEYAEYQEYGTRNMSAKPYMRPALMQHRATIRRLLKKEIHEALKRGK